MFCVYEEIETYEGGFENYDTVTVEFENYDDAVREFEARIAAHIEAGHEENFRSDKTACYVDFDGGKYAAATYTIIVQ